MYDFDQVVEVYRKKRWVHVLCSERADKGIQAYANEGGDGVQGSDMSSDSESTFSSTSSSDTSDSQSDSRVRGVGSGYCLVGKIPPPPGGGWVGVEMGGWGGAGTLFLGFGLCRALRPV